MLMATKCCSVLTEGAGLALCGMMWNVLVETLGFYTFRQEILNREICCAVGS